MSTIQCIAIEKLVHLMGASNTPTINPSCAYRMISSRRLHSRLYARIFFKLWYMAGAACAVYFMNLFRVFILYSPFVIPVSFLWPRENKGGDFSLIRLGVK